MNNSRKPKAGCLSCIEAARSAAGDSRLRRLCYPATHASMRIIDDIGASAAATVMARSGRHPRKSLAHPREAHKTGAFGNRNDSAVKPRDHGNHPDTGKEIWILVLRIMGTFRDDGRK